jgi:hypothetical protein
MASSFDSRDTSTAGRRARYLGRARRSVGFGIVIGLCITILRPQRVSTTLIYSMCIALLCWFFIDIGRYLVAVWVKRKNERAGWPGWRWMMAVVIVGSGLGFLGGTQLGDLLTGEHTPVLSGDEDLRHVLGDLLFVLLPAVIITYFFNARSVIADREAAAQAAQRQAAESRLRLLEAQLEPHMFFNTLVAAGPHCRVERAAHRGGRAGSVCTDFGGSLARAAGKSRCDDPYGPGR